MTVGKACMLALLAQVAALQGPTPDDLERVRLLELLSIRRVYVDRLGG